MEKKTILVWETLGTVSGGQKMTLTILDLLSDQYAFYCLIPSEGRLSEELKKRDIPYALMGDQTLPTGVKGKSVIFRYGAMSLRSIAKSLRAIRRVKPDILYAPGPAALPWSAVCGSLTGKPVVWHLHHVFLDGATKKLLNLCGAFRSVREIVAVSNCVGDQIVKAKAREKVRVLYNPVDVEKYAGGKGDGIRREAEALLGRSLDGGERPLILGHVALIQRSKMQDFVLKMVDSLRRQGRDAVALFAGECREEDYHAELQQQVKALGLENSAAFLGRRNDIPDLLNLADLLVIPSAFEGFPLAGLEAASAGVPVAACNVAGAKEFVEVSGDGAVFSEGKVEEAVAAVRTILDHYGEMSEKGRRFASSMSETRYRENIRAIFARCGDAKK